MTAWTGHQHLTVIDNSTSFEGKMSRAIGAIERLVGLAQPAGSSASTYTDCARKWLLRSAPSAEAIRARGMEVFEFELEQIYLMNPSAYPAPFPPPYPAPFPAPYPAPYPAPNPAYPTDLPAC